MLVTRPLLTWRWSKADVACQRDGTTALPGVWDHLEVSVSILGLALGVNTGALTGAGSLSVGGAFDDEGVRAGGEPVYGGLGEQCVAHHGQPLNCNWSMFLRDSFVCDLR